MPKIRMNAHVKLVFIILYLIGYFDYTQRLLVLISYLVHYILYVHFALIDLKANYANNKQGTSDYY